MMDRVVSITEDGGKAVAKGEIIARWILPRIAVFVRLLLSGRPGNARLPRPRRDVAAGCVPGWSGGPGKGRALGVGEVKFTGQILPTAKKVTYKITMKRVIKRKLFMGMADGTVEVDGREIYAGERFESWLVQDIKLLSCLY